MQAKGAQIRTLVESALSLLPETRQAELEWLLTTARAMALLGEAVENRNDAGRISSLRTQFVNLIRDSSAFEDFQPYASSKFLVFFDWLDQGWKNIHF